MCRCEPCEPCGGVKCRHTVCLCSDEWAIAEAENGWDRLPESEREMMYERWVGWKEAWG